MRQSILALMLLAACGPLPPARDAGPDDAATTCDARTVDGVVAAGDAADGAPGPDVAPDAAPDVVPDVPPGVAVFSGNSIGANYGVSTPTNGVFWTSAYLLGWTAGPATRTLANVSISGIQTPALTTALPQVAARLVPGADNVAFLLEIGNHIQLGNATAAQAYAAALEYVARARAMGFRRVFVLTVTPRGGAGVIRDGFEAQRRAVNTMLAASLPGAVLIDLRRVPLLEDWANNELAYSDSVHWTDRAHLAAAEEVARTVRANP